jgi:Fur family peroxide stress response transcriptional regulator
LERFGLVKRVTVGPGPARYDANPAGHHHFVCTSCRLVRDLYGNDLDSVSTSDRTARLGRVDDVEVRFYGVCEECLRREEEA